MSENLLISKLKTMIVYENDNVIVIDKPAGVPSQMGSGLSYSDLNDVSVDKMLQAYCS